MIKNKKIATLLCFLFLGACATGEHRTVRYDYFDGKSCTQSYDSDHEVVTCECNAEFSNNYTKYSPNFYRRPRPNRPGVEGYCMTPDEYRALNKYR